MKQFNIYFSDLNNEAQNELLDLLGASSPKDYNWDMDLVPLATVDFEEDGWDEEHD